jgi:hypothetical protein
MAAPTDRSPLTTARTALAAKRAELIDALFRVEQETQRVRDAKRQFAADSLAVVDGENDLQTATTAADQARAAVDSATAALTAAISSWLTMTGTSNVVNQTDDVARLETTAPLVLFPVRIETRFESASLKLRVYPDEIFLNSHETALTEDEYAAGKQFYDDLNTLTDATNNDKTKRAHWTDMVRKFGAERSAFILRTMLPALSPPLPPEDFEPSDGIPAGQNLTLIYPNIQRRAGTWTRPAEAILPDRWVVVTRRGNVRKTFLGKPIPEPLSMTPDPGVSQAQQSALPNGYVVDDKLRWTVDFARAVLVGMALEIPLTATEAQQGFDGVMVFGIKSSMSAADGSLAIEKLLDAQHYTRGMAFVRQGSVTNNSKDRPTSVPMKDDAGNVSFDIERDDAPFDRLRAHPTLPTAPGSHSDGGNDVDGYRWTKLLGVPGSVVGNIDRAFKEEWVASAAMNRALWPLTYGFFLKFMMEPVFSEGTIQNAKNYCANWVFPRGPVPTVRIGAVPYGLLPVASLSRWQPRTLGTATDQSVESGLLAPLRRMLSIWKSASGNVKRIKPGSSAPDVDLLSTLALASTAQDTRLRFAYGPTLMYDAFNLFGWDFDLATVLMDQKASDLFQLMTGHPEWRTRLGRTTFLQTAFMATAHLVDAPEKLSETEKVVGDYISALRAADFASLVNNQIPGKPEPSTLLYELLRIATITQYAQLGDHVLQANHTPGYSPWAVEEVIDIAGVLSSAQSIIKIMFLDPTFAKSIRDNEVEAITHRNGLAQLRSLPTAELDRLLRETLDLASHRVDAWATAFATRRVFALRDAQEEIHEDDRGDGIPEGTFFGGYAWVEDLRPLARTTVLAPDGAAAEVDATNGGFVHTPSSRHGMAAATLRSGYQTFSKEDPQKFAFDLSSGQVRSAMQMLDEVRAGRHVGEVLGYRFERGLQDGHPGVAGLNGLRFTFRNLFPLVAGKNGVDTAAPADHVAARNVVDGLALYRAYKAGSLQFNGNPLPAPGTTAHTVIVAELDNLVRVVDSVGDLLVAEGVFQLAGGNVHGALPSLRNLSRGGRPPNPEVAQSPRAGRGVTHRLVYVFQDPQPALSANWPAALSARAQAEPVLNAWLGSLIGDPSKVKASVTFTTSTGPQTVAVYLNNRSDPSAKQLGLHPLDVLALARAVLQPGQAGLLDTRIVFAAIGDDPAKTDAHIDFEPTAGFDPAVDRTFPEVMELAGVLGQALAGSRVMGFADLLSPSDLPDELPAAEPAAITSAIELESRATAAKQALDARQTAVQTALSALDAATPSTVAALRQALRSAADIAPEQAFAPSSASAGAVGDSASELLRELSRRKDKITQLEASAAPGEAAAVRLQRATSILKAIYGADLFVMPSLAPPRSGELVQALAAQTTLLGGDKRAPFRFVEQAWHSREQLAKVRKLALYAGALGAAAPRADVVQFPFVPGEKWLALPFATAPEESRIATVLFSQTTALDPTSGGWRGIVFDSWTEGIPATTQPTSIAFNYNGPRAEAPQCVLVVAPSSAGAQWSADDIVATLEETLDLAKIRAVDRELLGNLGQVLPATMIPMSPDPTVTPSAGVISPLAAIAPEFSQGFLP